MFEHARYASTKDTLAMVARCCTQVMRKSHVCQDSTSHTGCAPRGDWERLATCETDVQFANPSEPRRCRERPLPRGLAGSIAMAAPAWSDATYTRIRGQWPPSRPAAGAVPKPAPVLRRRPAAAGNLTNPAVALDVVREDLVTASGFEPTRWTKIIDGRPCQVGSIHVDSQRDVIVG